MGRKRDRELLIELISKVSIQTVHTMTAIQILKVLEDPLISENGIAGQGTLQAATVPAVPASLLR